VVIEKQSGKVIGIQTGLEQDKPNIIYVLPIKKIMEYKDQGILKKIYSSHFDVYSPHFCNDETIKRYLNSTIRHCNTFIINASNEIEDNYRKFGNIPDERGRNNQIHNYLDYELRLAKSYSQTIQHYEYSSFWSYDDFNNESQDTQRNVRSVADWLILEYAIEYSIENGDPPIFDRYCLIKKIRKIINNADRFISKTKDVLEDFRKLEKNALNNRIMLLLARIFDNFHVLIECNNVDHSESIKDIYINKNTRIERIANSNFILVSYKNNQQKMLNAFFYELFLDVKRIVKLSDTKSIFIGFFNSPGGEYYFNFEKIDLNELNALSNNESGTLWITTELFHFLKSRSIIDVETQPISKKLKNSIIYELKNVG
jgi:hypothetical protein